MKTLSRYRLFLGLELLVVVTIILIFKLITDRMTAGLIAGSVFFFSTLAVMIWEWRAMKRMTFALWGAVIFMLGGVFPVLLMRWLSWGEAFERYELWGISGAHIHKASNVFFMIFLIGIFISLQREQLQERAREQEDK